MSYSPDSLLNLLKYNALFISFDRRNPVKGVLTRRNMVCTNSSLILQSVDGNKVLNYREPTRYPIIDPRNYDLVITWDILMQDFRMIPSDSVNILYTVKDTEFWPMFKQRIMPLTTIQKESFMFKGGVIP